MKFGDAATWYSALPVLAALVVGLVWAGSAWVLGAVTALPVAVLAGLATAWGWQSSFGTMLGATLVGVLVRFAGMLVGGFILHQAVSDSLPAITVFAMCLIAGVLIDAVIRSSSGEDMVRA